ncbi:Stp1/IreP family PP2C-type Ser/Thr phosphatase [Brevibacillus sp. SYP-B805]|uniref:Stp1/IreP family PP2C-type Ser/Thr phosphatase n=1 Tax=Brevibacillus sp. SYP-B805 TaxID=1578199 RepID=UPI0013EBAEA7|nr:Stp1/IreP family PP2C-type Ser/Thr phosphatase [Brevibacillus sp. SYP-B805]NGQ93817.1 Stp1/IreP family PP2C-type Ser/Thr phosphatase [Brevibacillus sp. SYP-B805]
MEIAMKSHVGRVRQVNEDYYACMVTMKGRVLAIVADGMGGHRAGDVASRLAVEKIVDSLQDLEAGLEPEDERERLMNALRYANEEVYRYAEEHPECSGMGTTVVAALLGPTGGITAHIGDSRLYHFGEGRLSLQTEDHSLVQELMRSGQITMEEASVHPQRNVLMRALGTEKDVRIDLGTFSWVPGDVVLLCTDGLSNKVSPETMEKWLVTPLSLQEQVDALVQQAIDAGGEDNITLVAVRNVAAPLDNSGKEG